MYNHLRLAVTRPWQRRDPRLYQIAALAGLFGYGVVWLDFAVSGLQTVLILATVLLMQALRRASRPQRKVPAWSLRSTPLPDIGRSSDPSAPDTSRSPRGRARGLSLCFLFVAALQAAGELFSWSHLYCS